MQKVNIIQSIKDDTTQIITAIHMKNTIDPENHFGRAGMLNEVITNNFKPVLCKNRVSKIIFLLRPSLLPGTSNTRARQNVDTSDISNLSLEDLMKYKSQGIPSELESKINAAIEVASLTPLSSRKSPGIVSVITGAEIQRSGARDLMDILKFVPGIDFAVDALGSVPEYAVPGDKSGVLAFPNHKITLATNFDLTRSLYISPSFIFYSKKDGIAAAELNGNYIYKEFPRTFYANLFVERDNFFAKGLRAGIGVYDIFNQKTIYIQPYNSGHAALPGASREFAVRLNYNFHFKEARK